MLAILHTLLLHSFVFFSSNTVIGNVTKFEDDEGICRACLFNSKESMEKEAPVQCVEVKVVNKKAEFVFRNLPDGEYAIMLFHDRNGNGKMDTNFLGIPKEGYGASQNKLPFAAAPKFEANKFIVKGGVSIRLPIKLRNL